jgi:hypothetical protein
MNALEFYSILNKSKEKLSSLEDKAKRLEHQLEQVNQTRDFLKQIPIVLKALKKQCDGIDLDSGNYYSFVKSFDENKHEVVESNVPDLHYSCSKCKNSLPVILNRDYDSGPFGDDDDYYYNFFVFCPEHGVTSVCSFMTSM